MKIKRMCAFGGALLGVAGMALADTGSAVTLSTSDGYGGSSWNAGTGWSDKAAPSKGKAYLVQDGKTLRTPNDNSCPTFAGDSLTLDDGAVLNVKSWNNATIQANWILYGCNISNGQGDKDGRVYYFGGNMAIKGTAAKPTSFCVSANSGPRCFMVNSPLSGDEDAVVKVSRTADTPDGSNNYTPRVKFAGDNKNYKGRFLFTRKSINPDQQDGNADKYILDFDRAASMGAGVSSGDWLTMGDGTVLYARGLPMTAKYPLKVEGNVRISACDGTSLSGRRGGEAIWFGNGGKITGDGKSVISFTWEKNNAVALGDVQITGVSKITTVKYLVFRVYPGYNNPQVALELSGILADEADGVGPVVMKDGGYVSPGYGRGGVGRLGLASLEMQAGSYLLYSVGNGTNDFVRIDGNLTNATGGKIVVAFDDYSGYTKPGDKLYLLSAANLGDEGVTADDFVLDNTAWSDNNRIDNEHMNGTFSIEEKEGTKYLVFTQTSRGVVRLIGQDSKGASCFAAASSSSGKAHWSDNAAPSAENDYLIPDGSVLRVNTDGGTEHTFAGHSLIIRSGGDFGIDVAKATVGEMRLEGGGGITVRGDGENYLTATKATVSATKEPFYFTTDDGGNKDTPRNMTFRDASALAGSGDLRFRYAANKTQTHGPYSEFIVNWDATDFTGGIQVTGRSVRVSFKDERAMGGPAPSFRADRLKLEGNAELCVRKGYTMSDPTRGIMIGGGSASESMAVGATINVLSGPLVVSNLISGTTMLRKTGNATLALCCPTNAFSGQIAHKEGKLTISHRDTLAKATKLQCYSAGIWIIDTPDGMTVSSKEAFIGNDANARFRIKIAAFDTASDTPKLKAPIFRVKGAKMADAEAVKAWIRLEDQAAYAHRQVSLVAEEVGDALVVSVLAERSGMSIFVR